MIEDAEASDESIGRPSEWQEGRHRPPASSNDPTTPVPANCDATHEIASTPVTRDDYDLRKLPLDKLPRAAQRRLEESSSDAEATPGGDAG